MEHCLRVSGCAQDWQKRHLATDWTLLHLNNGSTYREGILEPSTQPQSTGLMIRQYAADTLKAKAQTNHLGKTSMKEERGEDSEDEDLESQPKKEKTANG